MTPDITATGKTATSRFSPQMLASASRLGITAPRCEALAGQLVDAVGMLGRRKAAAIPEGHIEDYLRLGWMRWQGGALALTVAGHAIHEAMAYADTE